MLPIFYSQGHLKKLAGDRPRPTRENGPTPDVFFLFPKSFKKTLFKFSRLPN
jgi:hypothetical protein